MAQIGFKKREDGLFPNDIRPNDRALGHEFVTFGATNIMTKQKLHNDGRVLEKMRRTMRGPDHGEL